MRACCRHDDWAVAEDIVRELLGGGQELQQALALPIDYAAGFSSCAVVTLLLEAKSLDTQNRKNDVPLNLCSRRSDERL
jgi:hypothetical protein